MFSVGVFFFFTYHKGKGVHGWHKEYPKGYVGRKMLKTPALDREWMTHTLLRKPRTDRHQHDTRQSRQRKWGILIHLLPTPVLTLPSFHPYPDPNHPSRTHFSIKSTHMLITHPIPFSSLIHPSSQALLSLCSHAPYTVMIRIVDEGFFMLQQISVA